MATELDGITQYTVDEVKEIIANGTAQVIDVRTEEEYRSGHIPGIPLHPMQTVHEWIRDLDPDTPYIFVCRSGNRSQKVAEYLKANGFKRIGNCVGGMLAWSGDVREGDQP